MKTILFSLMSLILISCTNTEAITEAEVINALDRFDEGWKNKKAGVVDSILSRSYVYFTQSGGTFSRNNIVETAGSDVYKLDTMNRRRFEIKIEGNTAVVNTIWIGKGTYYGKPFDDQQRCSVVLAKINGKVQIISEHCTPMN